MHNLHLARGWLRAAWKVHRPRGSVSTPSANTGGDVVMTRLVARGWTPLPLPPPPTTPVPAPHHLLLTNDYRGQSMSYRSGVAQAGEPETALTCSQCTVTYTKDDLIQGSLTSHCSTRYHCLCVGTIGNWGNASPITSDGAPLIKAPHRPTN